MLAWLILCPKAILIRHLQHRL
uniref:Uncharacterized protein n=1 Tax=Arundo donax TaxID=35708 RepID=A0A0A9FHD2_ARUDO